MAEANEPSSGRSITFKRRDFLKAGVAGAAAVALPGAENATAQRSEEENHAVKPTPAVETDPAPSTEFETFERTGADFMADVLKTLPIDYLCSNPADKTAGLQESLTGPYGGNKNPEWITCTHEEISVAMGHGYNKIEGRMLAMAGHSTVGLMHAAMAVYNAYCDRVPVYLIFGNFQEPTNHAAIDASAPIREFIRWYTNPLSLSAFAENAVRAFALASTPPTLPVLVTIDADMQESPIKGREPKIPKLTIPEPPAGDEDSVRETARLLAQAQNPVIIADRYARTQAGMDRLVELAELLQATVIDGGGRMNFPTRHALNQTYAGGRRLVADADVVLGLETNMAGIANQTKGTTISLGADGMLVRANYLEAGHYGSVDLAMSGDAEATMPHLIEAVKQQLGSNQRVAASARRTKLEQAQNKAFQQARSDMTYGWNASPISTARLCAEVWEAVKDEDWSLPSFGLHYGYWPQRTWPMDKHYHSNGGMGGNGEGYNAPAALGAALANKKHGRFTVNIQCDGDLLYCPGVLWTAAHHQIPILNVMHNNRAYHQEMMYVGKVANRHNHLLTDDGAIGLKITNPNIDFAKLAQSMGVYAEGPIENPKDLGPALKRAVAVVKKGQPALIDVFTQPR